MADTIDRLVKEAGIESKQAGERGVTARSVKKATGVRWPSDARAVPVNLADMLSKCRTHSPSSRDEETLMQVWIITLSEPELLVACPFEPSLRDEGRHRTCHRSIMTPPELQTILSWPRSVRGGSNICRDLNATAWTEWVVVRIPRWSGREREGEGR